ncbi:MAG: aldo/keto reductase [Planctomycetia bacterium]|nr:aldo/keto reductase [Planctomycetia bacterium]
MIYRKIGRTNIDASVIAFGTFPLGGWMWGGAEKKEAIDALHCALENGINLFDTAPLYGYGIAEELVGEAFANCRDKVVIATKCGLRWGVDHWKPGQGEFHFFFDEKGLTSKEGSGRCQRYLRADSVIWEAEQSLKRLKTDYIDIYFTHAPDATTPIEETVDALMKLKKQGKILSIGCSNVSFSQMQKYIDLCELDVDQEKFNLVDQTVEENGLLELCQKNDVSFFSYTSLENGLLSGNMTPDRVFENGDFRKTSPRFQPDNIRRVNEMLDQFRPIADKYHISLVQLIISWTFSRYAKGHVLCGMRNCKSVENNVPAGNIELTSEEMNFMAEIARKTPLAKDNIPFDLD